jgi:polygalacturonase
VTLYLESGATILASEQIADYPVITARWEGVTRETYAPLIGGTGLNNIAVTGRGTIDGQGKVWWQRHREKSLAYPRPRLISFERCNNIAIEGITLTNSPAWTINPVRCENVTVDKVTILNPADSPNTDGINPDSCRNVHISNCHVDVGDDCVAIKAGFEAEAPELRAPCENITVTNCTMVHGHGGVVIGSDTNGGVRNVAISNCVFIGTDRGIRMKSRRGRGGVVEDIRVSNIVMQEVLCPFTMNLYYNIYAKGNKDVSDKKPKPVNEGTPLFRRIHFAHITARDTHFAAAFLYGLPEAPIEDVSFDDATISMATALRARAGLPEMMDDLAPMQRAGFFARNVRNLHLRDVRVDNQIGEAFLIEDSNVQQA